MNATSTAVLDGAEGEEPGVSILTRVFRLGPLQLPDFAPELPPEESLKLHEASRPVLKSCTLGECFVEGRLLVYPVQKPPCEVKGSR